MAHDIGRPRVCEELTPSVWIRSDRAGLQLATQIVLPRTIDPRTGKPVVTRVAAPIGYTDVGRWQLLRLEGIDRLLSRQIRMLRLELGTQVDGREAYLDAVLINVYGGPGVTNVWIDDLDVAGYVAVNGPANVSANVPVNGSGNGPVNEPVNDAVGWAAKGNAGNPSGNHHEGVRISPNIGVGGATRGVIAVGAAVEQHRHSVQLAGSELLVDGKPMFPRIVQHRGESLKLLQQIGFNAVWLDRLPAPELLEEANRLGIWLVCPPPRPAGEMPPSGTSEMGGQAAASPDSGMRGLIPMMEIGPQFDCVLAWNLGTNLAPSDLESTRRWADQVRAADCHHQRPLICMPTSDLRGFSGLTLADLIADRSASLGTSLDMVDYGEWLKKQKLLARPGTSIWTTVQTQPSEMLRQQLAAMEPGNAPPLCVPSEQIRLLAYTAVTSGSRGLLFLSDTPLDAQDPETRQRAMTLELLNLELDVIEPWAAAGSVVTSIQDKSKLLNTSVVQNRMTLQDRLNLNFQDKPKEEVQIEATILRVDRGYLLLPIWSALREQYASPQAAANGLTLVVQGIPDECDAYEITSSGLQRLRRSRVTGGIQVTLDEFDLVGQVLWTHDPVVIETMQRRSSRNRRRIADLQRQLATRRLSTVESTIRLLGAAHQLTQSANLLDAAHKSLLYSNAQAVVGDLTNATLNAQRANRALRWLEHDYWEDATRKYLASPMTSPAATGFATLPLHYRFIDRITTSPLGPYLLPGGDFENRDLMMNAGWKHIVKETLHVQTAADLVPQAAHSGSYGLRLVATSEDPDHPPPDIIEMAPVMFVSPAVPVEAGQIICIHGWVNVPTPINGNVDGLMVIDSISRESMADRIHQTNGWQQFAMYRVAPQSGSVSVIFALCGLGEAWIDDVAIQVVQRPAGVTQR